MINLKRYTGIDQYRNISFHWLNRYSLDFGSPNFNTCLKVIFFFLPIVFSSLSSTNICA